MGRNYLRFLVNFLLWFDDKYHANILCQCVLAVLPRQPGSEEDYRTNKNEVDFILEKHWGEFCKLSTSFLCPLYSIIKSWSKQKYKLPNTIRNFILANRSNQKAVLSFHPLLQYWARGGLLVFRDWNMAQFKVEKGVSGVTYVRRGESTVTRRWSTTSEHTAGCVAGDHLVYLPVLPRL